MIKWTDYGNVLKLKIVPDKSYHSEDIHMDFTDYLDNIERRNKHEMRTFIIQFSKYVNFTKIGRIFVRN